MTGHRGMIGRWVVDQLERDGRSVVGFDLGDGADLRDLAAVKAAAAGCSAIVHLGALAHDTAGTPEDIMAINVLGTWHVLLAAESAGVGRVVHFSSGQVLGIAEGERLPEYFSVDDEHPRRATRPYGLSKRLAEDFCHGLPPEPGSLAVSSSGRGLGARHLFTDRPATGRRSRIGMDAFLGIRRLRGHPRRR